MEDLWKRAKSFAEEAAKKSQTITTSSASAKISDLVSETAKRSREFVAETSKKTDEIKTAALKQADQAYLYPPFIFFEAGNKGTLSFSGIDTTKFRFEKEDKIRPFFETRNYWGIQRTRTKIKCNGCGRLVGHVYDDGPPMMDGNGQFGMGPSQVIPRAARYRFKIKALRVASQIKSLSVSEIIPPQLSSLSSSASTSATEPSEAKLQNFGVS